MRIVLAILLMLAPAASWADSLNWFSAPNGSDQITALSKTGGVRTAYFESSAATGSSAVLNLSCDVATFEFNPDEDGTSTGAEVVLWSLDGPTTTTTANNARKILNDGDGDGVVDDVTFDGSTAARTSVAFWSTSILVSISANPATADEFRVKVSCF